MRLRIAQRLKDAQNTCAMLTTFNKIDMRFVKCTLFICIGFSNQLFNVQEDIFVSLEHLDE